MVGSKVSTAVMTCPTIRGIFSAPSNGGIWGIRASLTPYAKSLKTKGFWVLQLGAFWICPVDKSEITLLNQVLTVVEI